jgi:hypothetical protein
LTRYGYTGRERDSLTGLQYNRARWYDPHRAMKEEAAAFGFYESLGTTIFPKLQILPIKGLIEGTISARYPDLTRGGLTFKKAKKEKTEGQLTLGDDVAF